MLECSSCPFHSSANHDFSCLSKKRDVEHIFYSKGDVIFDEKERLGGLFCIQKGTCKISKMSSNGREQIIDEW